MSEAYGTAMEQSVNCVIISGKRSGVERIAACLVRADTRADVNTVVKKLLDVRKCSFHPMDRAVEETELESGGLTPLVTTALWPLLVVPRPGHGAGTNQRRGAE